jgi:NADPH:quinone reductase-like Zn-dependent oxidoreductase
LLWRPNSARPDEVLLADGRAEQGVPFGAGQSPHDGTTTAAGRLARYVERGELRPIIERVCPLAAIRGAHRVVESGHARGKRVLDLSE